MLSHWARDTAYYRCRFPNEYGQANHVDHPLNVNLREDLIIRQEDRWLAGEFAPHRMSEPLRALADSQRHDRLQPIEGDDIASNIAECNQKLAQYRAALETGANPAPVAAWIAETEAEKASYALARVGPSRVGG